MSKKNIKDRIVRMKEKAQKARDQRKKEYEDLKKRIDTEHAKTENLLKRWGSHGRD